MDTSTPRAPSPRAARVVGAVVAAILAVASSLAFATTAEAADKVLKTDRNNQGWYWSSNKDVRANVGPLAPSAQGTAASPISPGHLGVAWRAGQSDMRTYLAFDLTFIAPGSTLTSMVIQLTVSRPSSDTEHTQEHAGGDAPATSNEDNAKIKACMVNVAWGNAEGAPPQDGDPNQIGNFIPTEPYARQGGIDNETCVQGKRGAIWTFDITPIAAKWVSQEKFNNGVVLLPEGGQTDVWTVEFHGAYYANAQENPAGEDTIDKVFVSHKEEAVAKVSYVPAVAPPPPPPIVGSPPPVDDGGAPPPPTSEPLPPVARSASPSPSPLVPVPVSKSQPKTPWYLWLAFPLGGLGFVALSRALGREGGVPSHHVADALRRRHEPGD